MDFHMLLLKVEGALGQNDLNASTFLCADILACNPNTVQSFKELFSSLMDRGVLSEEQPQLLIELLLTIHQPRLVQTFELNSKDGSVSNCISSYRKLLYELSEYITESDLKSMKFLLSDSVPRRKLENVTTLDVFLEMERLDLISDSNLDQLERIFDQICPVLNAQINQYKTQQANPLRSSSVGSKSNQVSKGFLRTGSLRQVVSQKSPNPSNTPDESKVVENPASRETSMAPGTCVVSKGLGTYRMTSATRGICVIISNQDFSWSTVRLGNREGTRFDADRLKQVFDWLGFDVWVLLDLNVQEMLAAFLKFSKKDHSQMDCLVCCILTHGLEGSVYGVDGHTVKIKELMEPFDGHRCPSLAEKPKMFFIQACQGTQDQKSLYVKHCIEEEEAMDICSDAKVTETIPSKADFLLGMATVPSYVSYRDRRKGSWYIQSLCQNLINLVPNGVDLISILTQVNADVSEKTAGYRKQMPQPAFSLRKKVVFPIPTTPPPT